MGITPKKSQVFSGVFIGNINEITMNFFTVISLVFHCIHSGSVSLLATYSGFLYGSFS